MIKFILPKWLQKAGMKQMELDKESWDKSVNETYELLKAITPEKFKTLSNPEQKLVMEMKKHFEAYFESKKRNEARK